MRWCLQIKSLARSSQRIQIRSAYHISNNITAPTPFLDWRWVWKIHANPNPRIAFSLGLPLSYASPPTESLPTQTLCTILHKRLCGAHYGVSINDSSCSINIKYFFKCSSKKKAQYDISKYSIQSHNFSHWEVAIDTLNEDRGTEMLRRVFCKILQQSFVHYC